MLEVIFFILIAIILYVYIGYPLILQLLSSFGKTIEKENIFPIVTLFIPAHNEAEVIRQKIENSLNLDYPRKKLEIIVASDGSTDGTGDIVNDLAHPIQIAASGYKVVFEPEAVVYEKATSSPAEEFKRRARIVTRGLTAFLRYRKKYRMIRGMWGFCFVSHKLIRWFVPFLLIALFLTNLFLYSSFFKFTLYGQIGFYGAALAGAFFKEKTGKVFSIPFYFCLINFAALMGIIKYFKGAREAV